jgi:hypothetical protein
MEQEKRLLFGTTLKYLNTFDMALLKLAIIVFTLLLVSAWPAFANWVIKTHWAWFLVAWIVFIIPSIRKVWKK